jgi:O-antigen biosynthesis protein
MNHSTAESNNLADTDIRVIEEYWQKAHINIDRENLTAAIACYQKIIKLDPNCWKAYHYCGDAFLNLEQWEQAVSFYLRSIKINSDFEWSYYNLGDALIKLDRIHEAIAAYERALAINVNLPQIYRKLGDALQQRAKGDREALFASFQAAIHNNPARLENYYQAIELQPKNIELYLGLGNALVRQRKIDEAIVIYQMGLQINPKNSKILKELERILTFRQNDRETLNNENLVRSSSSLAIAKQVLDNLNKITLDNFLRSEARLSFPQVERPEISIIVILYNRAELTLSCLYSLLKNNFKSYELIIIDNASTDKTRLLLGRIDNAKIILNSDNKHFLLACNQASQKATGDYLLFLNNDAQILGDSLNAALKTIKSDSNVGAVGGKIILPDGTLQEAGSMIWQDGSCLGYGRGDSPDAPEYNFKRSVDYCSGAFLLTSRQLFLQLDGFDRAYQPAYYEETDYCVRLNKLGKQVIYDPDVSILHYEFASSSSSNRAIELQQRNHKIFVDRHRDWLKDRYTQNKQHLCFARTTKDSRKRILFIDDRVPHPYLGSGYTRSHVILKNMVDLGNVVTFYPSDNYQQEDWLNVYADIAKEVEVAIGYGLPGLEKFLRERKGYYDILFVSRPHNISHLNYLLSKEKLLEGVKIIYDAEALFCLREFEQKKLRGERFSLDYIEKSIREELELAKHSQIITSVSELEKQKFLDYGYQNVSVIGHSLELSPTPNTFQQRQHFLFVGSVYELESPNADSIAWLTKTIFPAIVNKLGANINLLIAGTNTVEELNQQVKNLNNPAIEMLGKVDDLTNLYNQSRVFIAPTRFAAGIPHKIHEAAAHGLPVITTSLIANQLGWRHESELLIADSLEEFAIQSVRLYQNADLWMQLRQNAFKRVDRECSPEYFTTTLKQILD